MRKYLAYFFTLYVLTACGGAHTNRENIQQPPLLMQEYILDEALSFADSAGTSLSKPEKIIIYQVMTRLFGNTETLNKKYGTRNENGVGKFNDISEKALQAIRDLGITHVWYTGVIEHAIMADYRPEGIHLDDADVVKGRAGSPYAIKDYYDINPDLAEHVPQRMQEFEALIRRTHEQNLKVIIDFIPNHVARKYISDAKPSGVQDFGETDDTEVAFHPNNNFYYIVGQKFQVPSQYDPLGREHTFITKNGMFDEFPAKATGNDNFQAQPDINDWFETVKLNYGVDIQNNRSPHFDPVPDTWHKMYDILIFWAKKGVDGFRCDMAEMVPVEFWEWVIPKVKQVNPAIVFIAEIYNPQAYQDYIFRGKFDYLYDKVQLYDTLRNILTNNVQPNQITPVWQNLRGVNKYMLRFLENHDEQRLASAYFATDPFKAIPAMVVSATLYTGPVMIYFGQEVGETGAGDSGFSGDDGRTTIFDYWGVPAHQRWMNQGKFDGGALNGDQQRLRGYYASLLNYCRSSEVLATGKLLDLTPYHQQNEADFPSQVYLFTRYMQGKRVMVLVNFGNAPIQELQITLPGAAIETMGMKSGNYGFFTGFSTESSVLTQRNSAVSEDELTFQVNLEPYGALLFSIVAQD